MASSIAHTSSLIDNQVFFTSTIFYLPIEKTMTIHTRTNEASKNQLIGEFNAVVSETEHLLKSVAAAGGEKAGALRASVEQSLIAAKEQLQQMQHAATEKAQAAAKATDEYVHDNPWKAIGIVAGVSAVIGVVAGLMLRRH
jgi:ElaB/YqjD/DUF883 family membrane-anchored ribosome-binding protein